MARCSWQDWRYRMTGRCEPTVPSLQKLPSSVLLAYGHEPHTTAVHLREAMEKLCEVHVIGPGAGAPDAWLDTDIPMIWVESGVLWYPNVALLSTRSSAAWIIDTHIRLLWRAFLSMAFDHAFFAQRRAVVAARHLHPRTSWLPLAAPNYLIKAPIPFHRRKYDVAFIGAVRPGSRRADILTHLSRYFNVAPYGMYHTPEDMMTVYNNARIVVNIPISHDLNMRAFEGPSTGAFLVTPPLDGLDAVLPVGLYGLVSGGSSVHFEDAVAQALSCDDLAQRAEAARSLIIASHTYESRAEAILRSLSHTGSHTPKSATRARALALAHTRAGQCQEIDGLTALPQLERALWRHGAVAMNRIRYFHSTRKPRQARGES